MKKWKIEQHLVCLLLLAKHVTVDELARELLMVLSTELGITTKNLLACMRDRASINSKVMSTLIIMYSTVLDFGYFSHTLEIVGSHFKTPSLDMFMKHWLNIFRHSCKSKLLWRQKTGQARQNYSPTRWWSRWECVKQVMIQLGDVRPILHGLCRCCSKES